MYFRSNVLIIVFFVTVGGTNYQHEMLCTGRLLFSVQIYLTYLNPLTSGPDILGRTSFGENTEHSPARELQYCRFFQCICNKVIIDSLSPVYIPLLLQLKHSFLKPNFVSHKLWNPENGQSHRCTELTIQHNILQSMRLTFCGALFEDISWSWCGEPVLKFS